MYRSDHPVALFFLCSMKSLLETHHVSNNSGLLHRICECDDATLIAAQVKSGQLDRLLTVEERRDAELTTTCFCQPDGLFLAGTVQDHQASLATKLAPVDKTIVVSTFYGTIAS